MKDGLKFVTITFLGALCVKTFGLLMMLMWPADNLDSVVLVCSSELFCISSKKLELYRAHNPYTLYICMKMILLIISTSMSRKHMAYSRHDQWAWL